MLLEVNKVEYQYNHSQEKALRNLSFKMANGEWLAIVGHNGSGKSTLARILNGLQLPSNGTVKLEGISLQEETIWDFRKRIGMVFQNPENQFVGTTVRDDVAFGLENMGVPSEDMDGRIIEALNYVKMASFLDQEPHHLSGGQKQRVAIASVLAVQPRIIILDEATSMLDPVGRKEVIQTVKKLKEKGLISVISITHDLEEASQADRIIVMDNGKIFAEGTPKEIFLLGDQLVKIGLDLPFTIKLGKGLKEAGWKGSFNHLTDEGVIDELWTLACKK